ncbi:MAG TPA: hypothetical protein PKA13_16885 [Geminicoccaceae bacterium]|nr:hypothetical protein [Geminicoccus sp.]HMU51453.1 hypothetical protein [Geminicoccaceae bacterium]
MGSLVPALDQTLNISSPAPVIVSQPRRSPSVLETAQGHGESSLYLSKRLIEESIYHATHSGFWNPPLPCDDHCTQLSPIYLIAHPFWTQIGESRSVQLVHNAGNLQQTISIGEPGCILHHR